MTAAMDGEALSARIWRPFERDRAAVRRPVVRSVARGDGEASTVTSNGDRPAPRGTFQPVPPGWQGTLASEQPARPPFAVAAFLLFVIGVSSFTPLLHSSSSGTSSLAAIGTGVIVILGVLVWLQGGQSSSATTAALWPLYAFQLWAFASLAWFTISVPGIQNLLIEVAFLLIVVTVARGTYQAPRTADLAGRFLLGGAFVAAAIMLAATIHKPTSLAPTLDQAKRGVTLFLAVVFAYPVAVWRYRSSRYTLIVLLLLVAIAAALARLALVTAAAMIPLAWLAPKSLRGWIRAVLWAAIGAVVLIFAITHIEPLRQRFLEGKSAPVIVVGPISISGTGRVNIWAHVWSSFLESPWIGKGAGSTETFLAQTFPNGRQPHSEYFRILHDYGIIGMAVWAFAFLRILRTVWKSWRRADDAGRFKEAQFHLAAFLAVVALLILMYANNVWVYIFVIAPVAAMVGVSLGLAHQSARPAVEPGAPPIDEHERPPPSIGIHAQGNGTRLKRVFDPFVT